MAIQALIPQLLRLLGPQGVISDPASLLTYESDALTLHHALPGAVLFPRTTEEAPRVAQLWSAARIP